MTHPKAATVLVAGATGRFGGVVDLLVARGHRVRAGARTVDGAAASRLRSAGADVVLADFDEPATLEAAAHGVDVVLAGGTAHRSGPDGELQHGLNLVDAVGAAATERLVFVSGAGADERSDVPVLAVKARVERHLRSSGVVSTVIAPVYFMENLFNPWNRAPLRSGVLPTPVDPAVALQQVAIDDVLAMAVLAIERPDLVGGERVEVASDQVSGWEAAASVSEVVGRALEPKPLAHEGMPGGLLALFDWLAREPAPVDLDVLHGRFPDVRWHAFNRWASANARTLREVVGSGETEPAVGAVHPPGSGPDRH